MKIAIYSQFAGLVGLLACVEFVHSASPEKPHSYATPEVGGYQSAVDTFNVLRIKRVTPHYNQTFFSEKSTDTAGTEEPKPESPFLFAEAVNKNLAAIQMRNGFDNVLMKQGMEAEIRKCWTMNPMTTVRWYQPCSNLHWPQLIRLYVLSSREPEGSASKMDPDNEKLVLKFLQFLVVKGMAELASKPLDTWKKFDDSENHGFTTYSTYFLAAQILAAHPTWNPSDHGFTNLPPADQVYSRWRTHWIYLLDERIKHGLLVEVGSHNYEKYTLPGLLNLSDFAINPAVNQRAKILLDLVFATTAMETLGNGARGGSQSRKMAVDNLFYASPSHTYVTYMTSNRKQLVLGPTSASFDTSAYFPPETVWTLWSKASKGNAYEVLGRSPGVKTVVAPGQISKDVDPLRSVFRSTYVTPSYVLGSVLLDLNKNHYAVASSEARSISLYVNEGNRPSQAHKGETVFADIPQVLFSPSGRSCHDKALAVQKKNAMVYQNSVDFFLHGGREVSIKESAELCYGIPGAGVVLGAPGTTRVVSSTRTIRGVPVQLNVPQGERHVGIVGAVEVDATRSTSDLSFSRSFTSDYDPINPRELFLKSPEGSTFIWVKPVASEFEVLDGYDEDAKAHSPNSWTKDVRLVTDKFSPVAVVVADAANYASDFDLFKREIAATSTLNAVGTQVTLVPPLRSQLEPGDVFLDSSQGVPVGHWIVNTAVPGSHNQHVLSATHDNDFVSFSIKAPRAGRYYLKARVRGQTGGSDSFKVTLGNLPLVNWHLKQSKVLGWQDIPVNAGLNWVDLAENETVSLVFREREAGTELDAVVALHERNELPAEIVFHEFLERSINQPLSKIAGVSIDQSPVHAAYTYYSPFVKSIRGSGIWDIQYGNRCMHFDINHTIPIRIEGELVREPGLDPYCRQK